MSGRLYSVEEIDALRRAVEDRALFGTCVLPEGGQVSSGSWREVDLVQVVEERLRTHMIAGHVAQNLIDEDTRKLTR